MLPQDTLATGSCLSSQNWSLCRFSNNHQIQVLEGRAVVCPFCYGYLIREPHTTGFTMQSCVLLDSFGLNQDSSGIQYNTIDQTHKQSLRIGAVLRIFTLNKGDRCNSGPPLKGMDSQSTPASFLCFRGLNKEKSLQVKISFFIRSGRKVKKRVSE